VIAVLGGTFDPPHYGHLVLAEEARTRFGLSGVILCPARHPPHKAGRRISPFESRMEMARLAAYGNPGLSVEELDSGDGPSYTIGLLEKATLEYGRIAFLIGLDSLLELPSWKNFPDFLDSADFLAGTRPGWSTSQVPEDLLRRVNVFEMPGLWISSSDLRTRFARSMCTRYLTPDQVRDYAIREGLYD
jgi:nicotinate-nucleotide adenylyltransferase